MAKKTISGHYGAVYNLGHNNRDVMPPNADPRRTCNNYNLVASGHEVSKNYTEYKSMNELWSDYRSLTSAYWNGYAAEKDDISALYQKVREKRREEREWLRLMTPNIYTLWIILLLLPLYIYIGVQKHQELQRLEEKLRTAKFESWVKRETFFGRRACLRDALRRYDREAGTQIVQRLDTLVHESEYVLDTRFRQPEPVRFATIEEIYNHVFEPGFRAFQAKQRPRRRYNGTYLEKIREDKAVREKAGNRSSQCPAEAIEVLFSIGDMDNTGYKAAPEDATKAETLLRALCDHLLADPHVCVVTTKELENPDWQPPFKHGLILTNLVGHFDEATPGVHATFIPYSRGCARGPAVQPSLGRAMAGMGYPSTWKLQLDEQGNPIPKLDRYGKPVTEKDGSIRYKKSPDQQGIIDWIEEQKTWLQNEMKSSYGWDREYKGSHPR